MNKNDGLNIKVIEANKFLYDNIVNEYETIDKRRSDKLFKWIDTKMEMISKQTTGESILDFGCGTGVIIKSAKKYFKKVYGADVSPKMVDYVKQFCDNAYLSDGQHLPFENESLDAVVCFAVLHHIYDYTNLFNEIHRVLKKGGILWTDHDIDINFVKKFNVFLKIYWGITKPYKNYLNFFKLKDAEVKNIYELSEIHSDGIDSGKIITQLNKLEFSDIKNRYHWFGLNKYINILIGNKTFKKGYAPLFSILARK